MYPHKNGVVWRKVERMDLDDLLALKNESWWGIHTTPIINSDDQCRWFDSLTQSKDTICMIAEKDDQSVGFLLIDHIDWIARTASIGGSIYKHHRGGELSLECFQAGTDFAFEFLNLHRLNAEVLDTNYAVQKIDIGGLGFTVEGVKRQAVYKCGRYYDSLVLGLLRSEWEQQERIQAYGGTCNKVWDHGTSERLAKRARRWRESAAKSPDHDVVLQPASSGEEGS